MDSSDPARPTLRVVPIDEPDGADGAGPGADPTAQPGLTLSGKYRLERLLGRGGMGSVHLATHLGTGRFVALKLIAPEFMRNAHFVERFRREARAAGRLRHPHIVDVIDFGFSRLGEDEVAYLVMEYLDGCSLGQVLREEGGLPLPRVVEILEQVCSAVHEAHQAGVVHRDLKPDNIWLEPDRLGGFRVKVLDFGIAQLAGEAPDAPTPGAATVPTGSPTAPSPALTRAGAVLGTPLYMSPEQCRGEPLDARSDLYSLGIIAYQMLAGAPPFDGPVETVLESHQSTVPPPMRRDGRGGGVPAGVAQVIASALEKDPGRRPPTALSLAQGLRAHSQGLGQVYRRAFALYSEHFPLVLRLSVIAHLPLLVVVLATLGMSLGGLESRGTTGPVIAGILRLLNPLATVVAATLVSGVLAVLAVHWEIAPLRSLPLRWAFDLLRRRRGPLLRTSGLSVVRILGGFVLLVLPGFVVWALEAFWAPIVLMEGLSGRQAFARSRRLATRCRGAMALTIAFMMLVPAVIQGVLGMDPASAQGNVGILRRAWVELASLVGILTTPLVSLVVALLYLRARQLGGETLEEVMTRADGEAGLAGWERRMRARLPGARTDPASGSAARS